MIKSLRWRLQLWYAALLLAVVGGFGGILYYQTYTNKIQEIDAQLVAGVEADEQQLVALGAPVDATDVVQDDRDAGAGPLARKTEIPGLMAPWCDREVHAHGRGEDGRPGARHDGHGRRRKDALVGASVIVGAVNRAALGHQPHACGTVGCLQAYPGSRNVIPGEVRMTLDFRHLEPARLDSMIAEVREVIETTCEEHGLTYELTPTADFPPLYFDKGCVEAVRGAAQGLGLSHMDIVSGAGHDAIFLAELGPAGMIFVPCEGGISHNEIENAAPNDLAAGCAVLLRAMLAASAAVAGGQRAA